jgi:hypothetical protein
MSKDFLIIGRGWKFLEWISPSINSIADYHDKEIYSYVAIDNHSSRSKEILQYYNLLLRNNIIDCYIESKMNLYERIWDCIPLIEDMILEHKYISFVDLDVNVNGHKNWLFDLSYILENNDEIGVIGCDCETMPPYSDGFDFIENYEEHKTIPNFWETPLDTSFATSKNTNVLMYLYEGGKVFGLKYHKFLAEKGYLMGKTNIKMKHYGWMRYMPEYIEAYKESYRAVDEFPNYSGDPFKLNYYEQDGRLFVCDHTILNSTKIEEDNFVIHR